MQEKGAIEVQRALAVGQQVPGVARQVLVHALLRHDPFRRVEHRHPVPLVTNAADLVQPLLQVGLQQVVQGIDPLVEQHEIHPRQRQHLSGEGAGMRTHQAGRVVRVFLLETLAQRRGADHVGRARIGILTVNHQAHQAGRRRRDALEGGRQVEPFRPALQEAHAEPLSPAALGQEQRPGGRLDGREVLAQGLVGLERRIRIDK